MFEHEGRDRYTVYEVEGSRVKGPIGYYDLDKDTDVIDHEDTEKKGDFNLLKFGPPTFTNSKVEKKEETKRNIFQQNSGVMLNTRRSPQTQLKLLQKKV